MLLVVEDVIYEKQFIMLWSRKDTVMVTCRPQSLLDCVCKHDERWWLVNVLFITLYSRKTVFKRKFCLIRIDFRRREAVQPSLSFPTLFTIKYHVCQRATNNFLTVLPKGSKQCKQELCGTASFWRNKIYCKSCFPQGRKRFNPYTAFTYSDAPIRTDLMASVANLPEMLSCYEVCLY